MRRPLPAIAAAALLIAGCSAEPAPSQPGRGSSPVPSPAAHGSLAECLQAEGVPDSGGPPAVLGPPSGVDPATWDAAMKACATLAPGPATP